MQLALSDSRAPARSNLATLLLGFYREDRETRAWLEPHRSRISSRVGQAPTSALGSHAHAREQVPNTEPRLHVRCTRATRDHVHASSDPPAGAGASRADRQDFEVARYSLIDH